MAGKASSGGGAGGLVIFILGVVVGLWLQELIPALAKSNVGLRSPFVVPQ